MAYFPNGTTGMRYEEEWCNRCVHAPNPEAIPPKDCAVLALHFMWNYDQLHASEVGTVKQMALSGLIPEVDVNGVKFPGKCRMFCEAPKEDPAEQLGLRWEEPSTTAS